MLSLYCLVLHRDCCKNPISHFPFYKLLLYLTDGKRCRGQFSATVLNFRLPLVVMLRVFLFPGLLQAVDTRE
ncbi:hypothetical protein GDO86_019625 [Hymenochirus boettgeri]|uniref:Uncharacterized protein n=1 Tax=Hymenochirus boettgeri TaxID=247094 RepID=A0A8T2ILD9_9PIPI|nr:hypothetical protein GDO86_019625 [Hymenochirus boettgeri]